MDEIDESSLIETEADESADRTKVTGTSK